MNLEQELQEITAKISLPGKNADGSYTRLPFSPEYFQAADILETLMKEEGLTVTRDSVGNVIGILPGSEPEAGRILTGSHLDTVQRGGLFDGALGIGAALLCVRLLRKNHITLRHPLQITGFQGEEGSSLGGTFGSRSMMGLIPPVSPDYGKILESYGISPENIKQAEADTSRMKCYLELHIEQGKILEDRQASIGIVSGIVGITRYHITVTGESNHAGTTPMHLRRDALTAAAKLLLYIDSAASRIPHLVATVGELTVAPGVVTIIPGKVEMTLEIRHLRQDVIDEFTESVKACARGIETAVFTFEKIIEKPSVFCDAHIRKIIQNICEQRSLSYEELPSGAGHDGNAIGQRMPVAMIFVPSRKGLSHCREEWTDWEKALQGTQVLYDAILELDKEV